MNALCSIATHPLPCNIFNWHEFVILLMIQIKSYVKINFSSIYNFDFWKEHRFLEKIFKRSFISEFGWCYHVFIKCDKPKKSKICVT